MWNRAHRICLTTVEIKHDSIMIDRLLTSLLENDTKRHENICYDYMNDGPVNHLYFKRNCKLIVIDLSKSNILN